MKGIGQLVREMSQVFARRDMFRSLSGSTRDYEKLVRGPDDGLVFGKSGVEVAMPEIRYSGRRMLVVWSVEPQEVSRMMTARGEKRAGNVKCLFIFIFWKLTLKYKCCA